MSRASFFTILTSAALLLLMITFSVPVSALVDPAYVDSKNQFSINPPAGWLIDASGTLGTAVILYGPTDSNFRINMNVITEATSLSLSDYVISAKAQLSSGLNNYQLVSETPTSIGGVAADELVNTFTQGSTNIKDKQDILVQNGKAYVVTSTALQTNYGTYQALFDESIQTFKIVGAAFPWLIVTISIVVIVGLIVGVIVFFWRRMSRANVPPPMQQPMPQPPASNPPPRP